jgi:uncharacterized protein with HEPN domain
MRTETSDFLERINDAALFVLEIVRGRTIDDYRAGRMLRQAIERNFELIGAAAERLREIDPATASMLADFPWVTQFRTSLAEGDGRLGEEEAWRVVREELPGLHAAVRDLLAGAQQQG